MLHLKDVYIQSFDPKHENYSQVASAAAGIHVCTHVSTTIIKVLLASAGQICYEVLVKRWLNLGKCSTTTTKFKVTLFPLAVN